MAIRALGEAVQTMAEANFKSQIVTAESVLVILPATCKLNENYSDQLNEDQEQYYADSLGAIDPTQAYLAAQAAADYAKYSMDSAAMSEATNAQAQILQNQQTMVQTEGNAMGQVYGMEEPIEQMQQMTSSAILSFLAGA